MFGSHLSIAGGMHNALLKAEELGFSCVQVFTKNQQQWKCKPLGDEEIARWRAECRRLRFTKTVSHDSYLINLASPDEVMWNRSIDLFVEEVRRCDQLGIPYLVTHPGAHMGSGEEAGMKRVAAALEIAYERLGDPKVTTCLEATAGQGSCLGHRLEHLAGIRRITGAKKRVAYCLDTAHCFAAGYDFRGRKFAGFRREVDKVLKLSRVKVFHVNDSKVPLGSRVDRHAHIGHGQIGLDGFRPLVRDKAFADVPKILETPKEEDKRGRDWDVVNLKTLKQLM